MAANAFNEFKMADRGIQGYMGMISFCGGGGGGGGGG